MDYLFKNIYKTSSNQRLGKYVRGISILLRIDWRLVAE